MKRRALFLLVVSGTGEDELRHAIEQMPCLTELRGKAMQNMLTALKGENIAQAYFTLHYLFVLHALVLGKLALLALD